MPHSQCWVSAFLDVSLRSTEAANQAKSAVKQNAQVLQKRLSEKSALLSKLDQAKMQETVNSAMSTLNESIGDDIPSFDEVRAKIKARYAKASAVAEINESAVDSSMLEIEEAARSVEAAARLNQIKADLGINTAPPPEAITGIGTASATARTNSRS